MADGKVTIDTELNEDGAKKGINGLSKLGGIAGGVAKAVGAIGASAIASTAALVKSSTEAYASYEQLMGGVKTLFGAKEMTLEEYANSVGKSVDEATAEYDRLIDAQINVFNNADQAYKTAGLSANQYMENVTGFSASLIQSLDGDTLKASEYANRAIIDMSDNANKMGSSMESITNAYQGFAKQNYTMLDNLKLGYGGTKEEMQRLIIEASNMTEEMDKLGVSVAEDDLSFGNIVNAISVVQKHLGITGTTAKEAATTIEGSANMMKASWENLLVGISDDGADFDRLIQEFVDSVGTYAENILPRIEIALGGVSNLIGKLAPIITKELPKLISDVLPKFIESGMKITEALIDAIIQSLPMLLDCAIQMISMLGTYIIQILPLLIKTGLEIIVQLANAIVQSLPTLIPACIDVLMTILETLIDNVDMLVDASIEATIALADGLIQALPILIDKAPIIISKLFQALERNAPKLLQAGVILLQKFVEGISQIIPKAVDKVKEIAPKFVAVLKERVGMLKEIGAYLIEGLWNGISDKFGWLVDKLRSFASNVTDKLKSFFGIKSPSRVMRDQVGKYLAEGVAVGFTDNDPMKEINASLKNGMSKLNDLSLYSTANLSYNGIVDYEKMAEAFAKSGMPITFKGREFGRIVRSYV